MRIAGVVVLYNPADDFLDNISQYLDDIDRLYVIDNSEAGFAERATRLAKLPKAVYVPNTTNLGIAKALNMGAERAVKNGYDFLLTMDQDSKAMPGMIPRMLGCLTPGNIEKIGIVSPYHLMSHIKTPPVPVQPCKDVLTVMTSGNLLSLAAFQQTGPFTEKLFIDAVDLDYCLRLHQKGFRIIQAYDAKLAHRLGNIRKHSLFGLKVHTSHHPAVRRYYITRNNLYLINKFKSRYPAFCCRLVSIIFFSPFLILLFEKDKLMKLKMIAAGIIDYTRGRFGRFQ